MKKKRIAAEFIILLICAAALFFVGWVQFFNDNDKCTVMVSKTSGVYGKLIKSGTIDWRWEHLIPKNVTFYSFDPSPLQKDYTFSSSLASSDIYSKILTDSDGKSPDFSYKIELSVELSLKDDCSLINLVKDDGVKTQQNLDSYLESKAKLISSLASDYVIFNFSSEHSIFPVVLNEKVVDSIVAKDNVSLKDVCIKKIEIKSAKLPDLNLYNKAKETYELYLSSYQDELDKIARENARSKAVIDNDRTMESLERFGQVLSKYPQLEELAKNGNISEIIKILRNN